MTREDKELLFKDLCIKFPYGIKFPYHMKEDCNHRECDCVATIDTITEETVEFTYDENGRIRDWSCILSEVKPYLRPMSSMTEEERNELSKILNYEFYIDDDFSLAAEDDRHRIRLELCEGYIDWLNAHHFDHRGLIPMGLALEAPKDMYKFD